MITAVDTNVLLDALSGDERFGRAALAAAFPKADSAQVVLNELGVAMTAMDKDAAFEAGLAWGQYRRRGGPRTQLVADFLVGAHALHHADALLRRDRGFIARYFPELPLTDPSKPR